MRYFYFPIEIQSRELPSRLSIVLRLLDLDKEATAVVIDQRQLLRKLSTLPPGVILHKDTADCNAGILFEQAKKLGWKTSALDEEGLVYFSESAYTKSRLGKRTLGNTDLVFAWGERQARVIENSGKINSQKIRLTGHPKFDIHRRLNRASTHRYILINTRFGSVNSGLGLDVDGYVERMRLVDEIKDRQDEEFRRGYFVFMQALYAAFLAIIENLSLAFPERAIRIRVHPAESADPYAILARKYSNVEVSATTSLEEDLAGASVLIHNGCTTGIEALAASIPVIIYEPIPTPSGDMALPNKFGLKAITAANLIDTTKNILVHNTSSSIDLHEIDRFVANFHSGGASQLIASALTELSFCSNKKIIVKQEKLLAILSSVFRSVALKIPLKFLPKSIKKKIQKFRYVDRKNPDMSSIFLRRMLCDMWTKQNAPEFYVQKMGLKFFVIKKG